MTTSNDRNRAAEQAARTRKLPRYGDLMLMESAGKENPRRFGLFVKIVHRARGRINSGTWYQVTDGKGDFWLTDPTTSRVLNEAGFSLVQIGIMLSAMTQGPVEFPAPKIGGKRPDAADVRTFDLEVADLVDRGFVRLAGPREFIIEPSGRAALGAMTRINSGAIAARLVAQTLEAAEGV